MIKTTRAKTIYERLHSVEKNSKFEIAALFHHLFVEGKSAPISKLEFLWTEQSRSCYIALALVNSTVWGHEILNIWKNSKIDDILL